MSQSFPFSLFIIGSIFACLSGYSVETDNNKEPLLVSGESIAIEVGLTQITFFELAQLAPFESSTELEGSEFGFLDPKQAVLADVVREMVQAGLGIEKGLLERADYKERLKQVEKTMLWQGSPESEIIWNLGLDLSDKKEITLMISDDLLPRLRRIGLIADYEKMTGALDRSFFLFLDEALVQVLNAGIERRLKSMTKKDREDLGDFINVSWDRSRPLLEWYLGESKGTYTLGDFIADYNGLPVRSAHYYGPRLPRYIVDQFFAREYYREACRSGEVDRRRFELGFPTYARRYARGEYLKALRDEIPLPTESILRDFYQEHLESFKFPQEIRVMKYVINEEDPIKAHQTFFKMGASFSNRKMKGDSGSQIDLVPQGEEAIISVKMPRFFEMHAITLNGITRLEKEGEDRYVFYRKLENIGMQYASFEAVRSQVEKQWKNETFTQILKRQEEAYLRAHPLILHPKISEVLESDYFAGLKINLSSEAG